MVTLSQATFCVKCMYTYLEVCVCEGFPVSFVDLLFGHGLFNGGGHALELIRGDMEPPVDGNKEVNLKIVQLPFGQATRGRPLIIEYLDRKGKA